MLNKKRSHETAAAITIGDQIIVTPTTKSKWTGQKAIVKSISKSRYRLIFDHIGDDGKYWYCRKEDAIKIEEENTTTKILTDIEEENTTIEILTDMEPMISLLKEVIKNTSQFFFKIKLDRIIS